jgi:hypothetical protein
MARGERAVGIAAGAEAISERGLLERLGYRRHDAPFSNMLVAILIH